VETVTATGYAVPRATLGSPIPKVWNLRARHSWFGDAVLVAFLLAQCFDGVFTYVGVVTFGTGVEANPIIGALMLRLGHGTALMTAKSLSAALGIALHLQRVHGAVAALACFYLTVAILPWIAILFF
jgi:hypothetical protein